jgi:hypothetical protein
MELKYSYNDNIGVEELEREYKEFTFNLAGLVFDSKIAEQYCFNNIFNFNESVLINLKKYIKTYATVNACASFNSNLDTEFFIGVNDDGFIKGIPYCGELPIEKIQTYIYKILSESLKNSLLGSINIKEFLKINITKINKPVKPIEKNHPEFLKFLKRKSKHKELLDKYDKDMKDWKIRFDFANQKLFKLINNFESRIILIEFIRSIDPNSSVIKLLYSDYKEIYRPHDEVVREKENINSSYYWITRWKDMTVSKLRKEKPIPIKSLPNTPLNLIMNVGEMIEWWMHYNKNMNLYIVSIEFKTSEFGIKFSSDNLFSYFDYNKRKWIKCHRTMFNGGPSCYPI